MALVSSKVAAGIVILADHFNKLWSDLTANHTHIAGEGGTIDHQSLSEDGDMIGMNHRHGDIEVHLLGGGPGPNSIDLIGGDKGCHGLAGNVFVAGSSNVAAGLVIQAGTEDSAASGTVTFDPVFSTIIAVTIAHENLTGLPQDQGVRIHTVSASGFSWASSGNTILHWIAVGTLAAV